MTLDCLARGALPLEQTLRYGVEIADALDKAHRQGIVRRDFRFERGWTTLGRDLICEAGERPPEARQPMRGVSSGAMFRRAGTAVVLALLIAAVPTIVSLCELRCVAAEIAPASNTAPTCAGHGGDEGREPSPSEHHDCGGHVLLAKGGATGIALRLDLAVVAVPPPGSLVLALERQPERVIPESADLSPPSGRSSDILRL